MCMCCVEYIKGNLNVKEFVRNFDEVDPIGQANLHPEIEKVYEKLWQDAAKMLDLDPLD